MLGRMLIVLAGLVVVACGPTLPSPTAQPQAAPTPAAAAATQARAAPVTVRHGCSSAGAINAPVYLAEDMGFFAEQGMAIDYIQFPSASEVIPSVTRGDIDAAAVGINPATLNALAANFGIKLVADTGTQFPGFPFNVVVVANELAGVINGPADLKGRKVALTPPGDRHCLWLLTVQVPG